MTSYITYSNINDDNLHPKIVHDLKDIANI